MNLSVRPRLNPKQRDHAHRMAAEFIVEDGEPLSRCESKRLRAWVGYVSGSSYVPPCDDTVDAHVQIIADDGRDESTKFNQELQQDGIKPATSADLWSDSGVSLYGAATHGIRRSSVSCPELQARKSTWKMAEFLAAASDFSDRHHTGAAIRDETDVAFKKAGIKDPVSDTFMNTSDGAANMVAAWHDRANKRCAVHMTELSVNNYRAIPEIHAALGSGRGVVGHFNHSIHGKHDLKQHQAESGLNPHNLTQDVLTRWRSTHDMCDDLRESQQAILIYDIRSKNPGDTYKLNKLSHEKWDIIVETVAVLQPCADGSRLLEGSDYPTSSLVLPTVLFLIRTSDPAEAIIFSFRDGEDSVVPHEDLHPAVQLGREALHVDLKVRWIDGLSYDIKRFYYIASGCDPRFKEFDVAQFPGISDEDREQARSWFRSEYEMKWAPKASQQVPAETEHVPTEPPTKKRSVASGSRRVASLGTMFSQNQTTAARAAPPPVQHTPLAELLDYLSLPQESLDCDVLDWWATREKRFPNLSRMARQYLGVPASSAAVERLFSAAGRDFSKLRHNMKADTLENLMWARSYLKHHPIE